jgi:hypothetical protein
MTKPKRWSRLLIGFLRTHDDCCSDAARVDFQVAQSYKSREGIGPVTIRWLIFLALATSSARGQTGSLFRDASAREGVGSHYPDVDMKSFSALQSFRLRASPLPTQTRSVYPDLSGLRFLGTRYFVATGARSAYTQTNAYTQTKASRPAHAQASTASCAEPCRPGYPYQQAPIDADDILAHCGNGLLGAAVGILHYLSVR